MEEASEAAVLGDFADAEFDDGRVAATFFRRDGQFFVNTGGTDGEPADFPIRHTFGFEPLQQYLVEFAGGRLQALTIAWDTRREQWFSLYPAQEIAPDSPLHWTGRLQNWNANCAECHVTGFEKGYDAEKDRYRSDWVELAVGCEACHGPGSAHRTWAEAPAQGSDPYRSSLVVEPATELQACAPCHARRHPVNESPLHGQPFLDGFMPEMLREGLYHPDGQIRDEVYVYGSFLQSRMHRAGVTCGDCHDPHGLEKRATGDALCTRCHSETPDERFPGLVAKRYDTPEHHQHPPGAGSACVGCHMAEKLYMQVDARRDHSFRVPRPDLSLRWGTPNACSSCHSDQTPRWAEAAFENGYGDSGTLQLHFGERLALARRRGPEALEALTLDPNLPGLVRASALEDLASLGQGQAALAEAGKSADPILRATAAMNLDGLPEAMRVEVAERLLHDPHRAVRIEAARILAALPNTDLDPKTRSAFRSALDEYWRAQLMAADQPAGRLNLAVLRTAQGDDGGAERDYRQALAFDPDFLPARFNLSMLLNRRGRYHECEQVLREGIMRAPRNGELHYSLGLLLAEQDRLDLAVAHLGQAAELMPERSRVRYNFGLALNRVGRHQESRAALREAQRMDPENPEIRKALALLYGS